MHFQIRKEAELARTRSQLYRKLWCSATVHLSQNDARYDEKQRENTESTKKGLFRQTQKTHAPRAVHKQHPNLLPNTLSSKGANQEVLLAVHPALRHPRSAPYRGERTSKLGHFIYHLLPERPPTLGRIRVDCEKLWSRRFSRKVHDPKKSHFCLGSFSLVTTNFWILSSRNARTRPNLASTSQKCRKIIEKQTQKFDRKCEKSDFVEFFSTSKKFF